MPMILGGSGTINGTNLIFTGTAQGTPPVSGVSIGVQGAYGTVEMAGDTGTLIDFGKAGADYFGRIIFDNSANSMSLQSTTSINLSTNGGQRLLVDSSGRVTTPNQPMVYAARTGNNWTNYGASAANYVFNTAYVNNGNHYNTSTGFFTCPVAGYYRVSASALMGQGGGSNYFYLTKNGSTYGTSFHCNTNGYNLWPQSSFSWIASCAANDTLNIRVNTNNVAGIYDGDHNSLTIELVG